MTERYPESVTYHPDEGHKDNLPEDSTVVLAHVLAEAIQELADKGHDHHWTILAVNEPETPRVIHPLVPIPATVTRVLIRCDVCGIPQVVELSGAWTAGQVMGMVITPLS